MSAERFSWDATTLASYGVKKGSPRILTKKAYLTM